MLQRGTPPVIPLRDFFRNSERTGFRLSDDGQWVAYLAPYKSRMNVFVQPRAGGTPVRITEETERDIAGYFWKGDDHIVYSFCIQLRYRCHQTFDDIDS